MPPVVRASERASQPITRQSSERSTWVCVWSISCGNIAVNVPQNGAGYTIAFSYTGPVREESEPTCIDACLRSGAASGGLRDERRTHDPNPDARAARTEGSHGGAYFSRDSSRRAPHNLYTDGNRLAQGVSKHAPRVTYVLPSPGEPAASPAPAVANRVVFDQTSSHRVIYTYSAADNAYAYSTALGALVDQDTGQPIKPVNVIVIQVAHHDAGFTDVNGAPAVDFDLQGTGPADVFTRGHHYAATWDLTNPELPLKIVGADGKVMHLPAGLTWIHLVDPGTPITAS